MESGVDGFAVTGLLLPGPVEHLGRDVEAVQRAGAAGVDPQDLADESGATAHVEHRPVVGADDVEERSGHAEVVPVPVVGDEARLVGGRPPGVQVPVVVRRLDRVGVDQVEVVGHRPSSCSEPGPIGSGEDEV